MLNTPSVLIVADHHMLRLGLRSSLERLGRFQILGEATDGRTAVSETQRLRPEVVVMDAGLPGIDGIEATRRIKQELPRTRVLMFTSHTTEEDLTAALGAGADGYCGKQVAAEQMGDAIDAVMRGEVWMDPAVATAVVRPTDATLSELEPQILRLIQNGMSNEVIASHLEVSPERIGLVMHKIIDGYIEKDTVGTCQPMQMKDSDQWLTVFVEDPNGSKIFAEKYLIEKQLGSGAMGTVFKARHLYMDRYVALKLLRPERCQDRFTMRHFQREAMAIANLQHKNIVAVHDFGFSHDGKPFLVMEYVEGTNLADILNKERSLPIGRAINLIAQVCAGLIEAHSKGIVHCDLKPSNILIAGSGANERVKLVDFGLAQIMSREVIAQAQLTDDSLVQGTPLYMSPEQCTGKRLDGRSDIYALGCILYEILTGANVFNGVSVMEIFERHCQLIPPTMSSMSAELFPPQLEGCVSRMLAKDPRARMQTMQQVMTLLISCLEPGV